MSAEVLLALNIVNAALTWLEQRNIALSDLDKRRKQNGGRLTITDLAELQSENDRKIDELIKM